MSRYSQHQDWKELSIVCNNSSWSSEEINLFDNFKYRMYGDNSFPNGYIYLQIESKNFRYEKNYKKGNIIYDINSFIDDNFISDLKIAYRNNELEKLTKKPNMIKRVINMFR